MLYFKSSTNCMDKTLKLGREEKLFTPPQRRGRTRLNQSQFEQVEVWIQKILILPLKNGNRNQG
ncbi:hypothetical protein GO684_04675, partial [Wolbachia endosymbiont of Litomosoides brasiliensis]|nr:hypothetical protein [Wolbachia endosymbiont of Litomosoides brasiliensis]